MTLGDSVWVGGDTLGDSGEVRRWHSRGDDARLAGRRHHANHALPFSLHVWERHEAAAIGQDGLPFGGQDARHKDKRSCCVKAVQICARADCWHEIFRSEPCGRVSQRIQSDDDIPSGRIVWDADESASALASDLVPMYVV
eukprot:CAMPEP_0115842082 /NCGR_PEP_ID=MMETSP0287-20121206/7617_1 /TAXON_ID=412157 /ORGANISM="Chrysochromulina rotalis, Strain UIO044" /LENGTH=140 /DNA_ID=CAMNT_0003295741 /DNA_START=85 /DNA_END=509 /DNA_ORIENTATION=+